MVHACRPGIAAGAPMLWSARPVLTGAQHSSSAASALIPSLALPLRFRPGSSARCVHAHQPGLHRAGAQHCRPLGRQLVVRALPALAGGRRLLLEGGSMCALAGVARAMLGASPDAGKHHLNEIIRPCSWCQYCLLAPTELDSCLPPSPPIPLLPTYIGAERRSQGADQGQDGDRG